MKIIDTSTNEVVATILGGENLTLSEALDLIGAVNVDLYSNDGDNIITPDGNRWWLEELDYVADSYQPEEDED